MKAYYLYSEKLEDYRNKIKDRLEYYKDGVLKFVKANDLKPAPRLRVENVELDTTKEKPSDTDFENIKRFYLAFRNLSDSQATDERLWAGLCHHSQFWEYLKYRWSSESEQEIQRRYFFFDGIRSIIMNGLARLWWYGRLTYNPNSENPFELTEYICGNLTEKGFRSLTHNFSNNEEILRVYLTTLMNFEKKHKLTTQEHEKVKKRLDLWGGIILLDSLSEDELESKITNYLNILIKQRKE